MNIYLNPSDIQAIATGTTAFFTGAISLFLFITARKDRLAFSFAVLTFFMSMWGVFGFLFHTLNDIKLAVQMRIISVSFIPLLTAGVIIFSFTFYKQAKGMSETLYRYIKVGAYVIAIILTSGGISDIFFGTHLVAKDIQPGALAPDAGPVMGVTLIYFIVGVIITLVYTLRASRGRVSVDIKRQAWLIVSSVVVGFILGGTRFQLWYGVEYIPVALAALGPPVFAGGIFYAVSRHHLFNVRVISAELLTFAIWTALFWRLITSQSIAEYVVNGSILVVVLILGTLLLRNILNEVRHREEVEKLNQKLENFNDILQKRVDERTHELREAKLHIEAIIENLTVGIIEYSKDGTIYRLNNAAETMLGVSRGNITEGGTDGAQGEGSDSLKAVMTPPKKTEQSGDETTGPDTYSVAITYPQYRELNVTTIFLRKYRGGSGRYIKLIQDVTRQKRVDRSKSLFMSIAAHQLRTPATAVKWGLAQLTQKETGKLSQRQRDLVDRLAEANQNLIDIVNNLLNASLIENRELSYEFQKGDVVKVVKEATKHQQEHAKDKSIELTFEAPKKKVEPVLFDKQNIKTVMDILLENAINYTPENGHVTVRVADEGKNIRVEVSDTGIGISEADKQMIFTKFFRSKKAISMDPNRSGLGLFVARHIIDQHNGNISVFSEENVGTSISFTLPKQQASAPKPKTTKKKAVKKKSTGSTLRTPKRRAKKKGAK